MSWDIAVRAKAETGGEALWATVYERNFTYNNGKIMTALDVHPNDLRGKSASQVVERIANAVRLLQERPSHYREMDPANGWGGADDCLDLLQGMLAACRRAPLAEIEVT